MTDEPITATGLGRAEVEAALEVASRAPSIHNTQPWEWVLRDGALELRAARDRQLAVADPDGHSLKISCGAALSLTPLALRAAGYLVTTERLPDPDDADLLARFTAAGRAEPSVDDTDGAAAALRRHSERRPFRHEPLPDDVVDRLRDAAAGDDVYVHFPVRDEEKMNLAVAVSWADRVERDDAAYIAEMQKWIRDAEVHAGASPDGVPVSAIPRVEAGHPRRTDVPVRDFEIGVSGGALIERDVDEKPLIGVILTPSDMPRQQLQAGESMMRLMVLAERLGVGCCPLSQAVDLAAFRHRVQTLMDWRDHPQMMLRLGYPPEAPDTWPRTPRRPISSVLTVVE